MTNLNLYQRVCLGMIVVLVGLSLPLQQDAYGFIQSTSPKGIKLIWKEFPIHYSIHRNGTPQLTQSTTYSIIEKSFNTWTQSLCTCISFNYRGLTDNTTPGFDPDKAVSNENIILFVQKSWPHAKNAVAVTSTIFNQKTGEIVAFDMEVNNVHFQFSADGKKRASNNIIDLQNTITHEVGHVLGLDHSPVQVSTMFASAPPGEISKRTLAQDDSSGICNLYPGQNNRCSSPLTIHPDPTKSGCQCTLTGHAKPKSPGFPVICFVGLFTFFFLRKITHRFTYFSRK